MRRALAGISFGVTLVITLSFLVPLGLLVRSQARERVTATAEQQATALAPLLAFTRQPGEVRQVLAETDPQGRRLSVRLPDGQFAGTPHAPRAELLRAVRLRKTSSLDVGGGWVYLHPVVLPGGGVAVIEAYADEDELTEGVATSWAVMSALALGLVVGSVLVADRLGGGVIRSARGLSRAAHALGAGDLMARVEPHGPAELREAGAAFNGMADRVTQLLAVERELIADLSHRLRTPLTALRLEAERLGGTTDVRRLTAAVSELESEVDTMISAARTPLASSALPDEDHEPGFCSVTELVGRRLDFWGVLAEQQHRSCTREVTSEATSVRMSQEDLATVVDTLLGNVFRHTAQGTALCVRVERSAQAVLFTVDDAGPGIVDPHSALARGVSEGGSTGLGLNIADRAVRDAGGRLGIARSPMGGARVQVSLPLVTPKGDAQGRAVRRRARGLLAR
ncbi:HAMP domain-containing sensor histidine kinase [Streptomyces sp. NPDC019396]|uniref:HAMP domain-containing sensor histidine kinase n=1 Tax=Streptomyces sp. NPDC019396 TaxID=3154687 RepID=UPI0033E073D9